MSTARELAHKVREDIDLRREAFSMSLYLSIVLLSALLVFDDSHPPGEGEVFLLELGTTVGLVLAHAFASWVSVRITTGRDEPVDSWDLLWVQLAGATMIASAAMLAVIIAPTSAELQAARITVAGSIGVLVFLESRPTHSTARAAVLGILALASGIAVAVLKSLLVH